jgi:hypothetical protein
MRPRQYAEGTCSRSDILIEQVPDTKSASRCRFLLRPWRPTNGGNHGTIQAQLRQVELHLRRGESEEFHFRGRTGSRRRVADAFQLSTKEQQSDDQATRVYHHPLAQLLYHSSGDRILKTPPPPTMLVYLALQGLQETIHEA